MLICAFNSHQSARKGGYDPCERCAENDRFWTMTDPCDSGFIPGFESGYCYRVLSIQENFDNAERSCKSLHDADLLLFDTDSEVKSFLRLFKKGMLSFFLDLKTTERKKR
jgi:hypothetical protein